MREAGLVRRRGMRAVVALLLGVLGVGCQASVQAPQAPSRAVQEAPESLPEPRSPWAGEHSFSECGEGTLGGMAACWGYTVEVEPDGAAVVSQAGYQAVEPIPARVEADGRVVSEGRVLVTLTGRCLVFGSFESPLGSKKLCK